MKFLKNTATYLLCAIIVCMPMSCVGPMGQAQGTAMKTEISKQIDAGEISEQLGLFLIAEINKRMDPNYSGGLDWDLILKSAGGIGLAVIGSLTGIRLQRGPAKPMDKSQANLLKDMLAQFAASKDPKVGDPNA